MKLKHTFIMFILLLITHIFGNKTLTISIFENYYVFNFMELMVGLLTVIMGVILILNMYKLFSKKNST